jgi:hypothetical protein
LNEENENRYKLIKAWEFTPERRVEIAEGDFDEFTSLLDNRKWWILATLPHKFDPDVVKEFYANAYLGGDCDNQFKKESYVRGITIPYDRETIEILLGNPVPNWSPTWDSYNYIQKMFFTWSVLEQYCCLSNMRAEYNQGASIRILRKKMNLVTKAMMQFMLANLAPNMHNSDVPKVVAEFLYYCVRRDYRVDAATKISDEIWKDVVKTMSDADKRKKDVKERLEFPSLITLLYEQFGLEVNRNKKIRPPIDKMYVQQWCLGDEAQEEEAEEVQEPVPSDKPCTIEELWDRMSILDARREAENLHTRNMIDSMHRGLNLFYQAQYDLAQQ